jgi:hypothetical protein
MSNVDSNNEHCEIAAKMLCTEAGLLDYRLVDYLNRIADLAFPCKLVSREVIALAIIQTNTEKSKR